MVSLSFRPRPVLLVLLSVFSLLLLLGCTGPGAGQSVPPVYNPTPLPPPSFVQPTTYNATTAPSISFEMTFLDVGYGDATLIRSGPMVVLFDAGPAESASNLVAALRARGIEKIDVLVLSSNNPLSIGGASSVMRSFPIGQLWTSGVNDTDSSSLTVAQLAQFTPQQTLRYGFTQSWGNFSLTALNPDDPLSGNPDSDSVVLKASYGNFCSLLFSDSEASGAAGNDAGTVIGGVDARIITGTVPINCSVLKVSHHGSGNAASFQLLERMQPSVGVISVGPNPPVNAYPEPATIRRLLLKNMSVYTTDRLGDVTISSDGTGYTITTEKPADNAYWRFINDVAYNSKPYWSN